MKNLIEKLSSLLVLITLVTVTVAVSYVTYDMRLENEKLTRENVALEGATKESLKLLVEQTSLVVALEEDLRVAREESENLRLTLAEETTPWYLKVVPKVRASGEKAKDTVKGWFTDVSWSNDLTDAVNEQVQEYNKAIFEWAKDRPLGEDVSKAEELMSLPEMRDVFEFSTTVALAMVEQAGFSEEEEAVIKEYLLEVFTFEKLAPLAVEIYEDLFTDEELQVIIDLYKTDVGIGVLEKMPLVMERAVELGESLVDEKEVERRLNALHT